MPSQLAATKVNADLSSGVMQASPQDLAQVLAQIRLDNALALFEEFVRATARHADAATLRGLERRFAERVQIQPSYWSQIKSRSRQIGERLARQFEHLCHKPRGWMDVDHGVGAAMPLAESGVAGSRAAADESAPRDDDERFIIGLVLTYYRRHPQRARTRLLDLLGEVLDPTPLPPPLPGTPPAVHHVPGPMVAVAPGVMRPSKVPAAPLAPQAEDAHSLWLKSQTGVAPLKRKK